MPGKLILIDTDILIDVSRNVPSAIETLSDHKRQFILSISMVTQLELINGCHNKKELHQLSEFIERFAILPITEAISTKTVELFKKYRLSHGVQIPDMLIASTALTLGIQLASKNRKDFSFIEGLEFVPYEGLNQ